MVLLPTVFLACTAWPRFDHLPVDTADRIPAGASHGSTGPEVAWSEIQPLAEPGDDDATLLIPEVVRASKGNALASTLEGTGWNYTDTPSRQEACDEVSGFPPEDRGFYTGDVDWRALDIGSTGVLCSAMFGEDPLTQIDVLLYEVDACGLPTTAVRHAEGADAGKIVGYGVGGAANVWAVAVEGPVRMAVVTSGWDPPNAQAEVAYKWGVSLLPLDENPDLDPALCPTPPGAVLPEEDP